MFVKPNANPNAGNALHISSSFDVLQVFDPATKTFLPPEGRSVDGGVGEARELYWDRRIADGEVTVLSDADGLKSVEAAEAARQEARAKAQTEAAAIKAKETETAAPAAAPKASAKPTGEK